ncbi:hypothetical protein GBA52_008237 [Prunus armeniaca]|nr:hypothetical protein GBA52_008237 [Prunus armeniaca]
MAWRRSRLKYVLSRWRKDIKRNFIFYHSCSGVDINNPVHRYDHLNKCIMQVVEEGKKSQDRYKIALGASDEIQALSYRGSCPVSDKLCTE